MVVRRLRGVGDIKRGNTQKAQIYISQDFRSKPEKKTTLRDRIRQIQDNIQKRRLERMHPAVRQAYVSYLAAEKSLKRFQKGVKTLKEQNKAELEEWKKKLKNADDEEKAEILTQAKEDRQKRTDYLDSWKHALENAESDYKIARQELIEARKEHG